MKKDDKNSLQNSNTASYDELELLAWTNWKTICSVCGCSLQDKSILTSAIGKHVLLKQEDISIEDFIHEFDVCLFTKKNDQNKPYKDYIWEIVDTSEDPPLKVIRGKLTGPCGITRDIIRNYQKKNCSYIWRGNKIIGHKQSFDAIIESSPDHEFTLGDVLANDPVFDQTEDKQNIAQAIKEYFSPEDAAILIALAAGISLADPELLNFLKIKKSACYNKAEQVKKKMLDFPWKEIFDLWQNDGNIGYTVINALIELLKVEKCAESFLIQATDKLL